MGEALAVLISVAFFILPILIMIVIYAAVLALIIWFIISFLRSQKERNNLLAEINETLKKETSELTPNQTNFETGIDTETALEKDIDSNKLSTEFDDISTDDHEQ